MWQLAPEEMGESSHWGGSLGPGYMLPGGNKNPIIDVRWGHRWPLIVCGSTTEILPVVDWGDIQMDDNVMAHAMYQVFEK